MGGIARWADLRRFTPARVGLGRAGNGLPTAAHLDFLEAHARARDAVHSALDVAALQEALAPRESLVVASGAPDRPTYLLRPDLGRRLAPGTELPRTEADFAFVVADGLCATGVQHHAPALIHAAWPQLQGLGLTLGPVVIVRQGRVAVGDPIGQALGVRAVCVLIGERPGLSSPDSLGAYLTWQPRPGRTDAERNCISNIRPGGMSHADAAAKLHWLLKGARALGATGVALKDEMPALPSLE